MLGHMINILLNVFVQLNIVMLVIKILLDAIIIGVVLIFMWFVWAYFNRRSDARLTKLAKAKYKNVAAGLNKTIKDNYELTTPITVVDRDANKVQVTFQWIPKKAGLAVFQPCIKTYDIKELCESYDEECDKTLICNEADINCIGV